MGAKADLLINIAVNSMLLDPRNPDTHMQHREGSSTAMVRGRIVEVHRRRRDVDNCRPRPSDFYYVQDRDVEARASACMRRRTGVCSTDGGVVGQGAGRPLNGCMDLAIQTDRALAMVFAACGTFVQSRIYRALDTSSPQTWTSVHAPVMGQDSLALAP
jgi:hypothetical protein